MNNGTWINSHKIIAYLKEIHGLTTEEYYALINYGDKDFRPKCPICKINYPRFESLKTGFYHTCSHACNAKYVAQLLIQRGIHNFLPKNITQESVKKREKYTKSFECICKLSCYSSIKKAKYDYAYLYLADMVGNNKHIHIGISKDYKTRASKTNYKNDQRHYFTNTKPICYGKTKDLFELEFDIKMHFSNRYYFKRYRKTEVYNLKDKSTILQYIKEYIKKNSTTIEIIK